MDFHQGRAAREKVLNRRRLLRDAAVGTVITALGGSLYGCARDEATQDARTQLLPDGRPRFPPGQERLLEQLKPMGRAEGEPAVSGPFTLRVHGEVEKPLELSLEELLALSQAEQVCDVHCVTGWSVFDSRWKGVRLSHLAELAGVKDTARHVIFECPNGYTANVPLEEALLPTVLVAHELWGEPLPRPNGPPVRSLVPHLYFWKSAKWLNGIRFSAEDEPGYWEVRGYHNHGDPWKEERYG
ncbi:MAG: molybdopterin-dependent oxidoreductase [Armatimonadota bacterium]